MANLLFKNLQRTLYLNFRLNNYICSTNLATNLYFGSVQFRKMSLKSRKKYSPVLTIDTINQNVAKMNFAVKGELLMKAKAYQEDLKNGKKLPFEEIIYTNQGDAHALGQPPFTFLRQVIAVCLYPQLMNSSTIPNDAKKRARMILNDCSGNSMGSYTDSQGLRIVREHIAQYVFKRDDGIECDPNNIFIMDGASAIITYVLTLFRQHIRGKPTGVMIPIPNYPLYSATLTALGLHKIKYYLNEEKMWALDINELQKAIDEARCVCEPRAIVVINPGNPTGQLLTRKNIEDIIKFAYREGLVVIADEVYQENIYDNSTEFHSFKKVKHELGPPYSNLELASFMSISKGYTSECGLRGGCVELDKFHKDVHATLVKAASVALCSNTVGQVALSVICKPPVEGDDSYCEYVREKCCILNGLATKARVLVDKINAVPGLSVNPVQGALYAFVKIDMPESIIRDANCHKVNPDVYWASQLLDKTGIVVVPGSGFGQKEGTHHFRTTILPPFEKMEKFGELLKKFHSKLMGKSKK